MNSSRRLEVSLQDIYDEFLSLNKFPELSADELLLEINDTEQEKHREFLKGFILMWEALYE